MSAVVDKWCGVIGGSGEPQRACRGMVVQKKCASSNRSATTKTNAGRCFSFVEIRTWFSSLLIHSTAIAWHLHVTKLSILWTDRRRECGGAMCYCVVSRVFFSLLWMKKYNFPKQASILRLYCASHGKAVGVRRPVFLFVCFRKICFPAVASITELQQRHYDLDSDASGWFVSHLINCDRAPTHEETNKLTFAGSIIRRLRFL